MTAPIGLAYATPDGGDERPDPSCLCLTGRLLMDDVFLLVLAGHLIGDFVAQTDWQASNKETNWRADAAHVVTYHVVMAILVLPPWHDPNAAWFFGISIASHALLDRRWPTRLVLGSTRSRNFSTMAWGIVVTDQSLHLSILAMTFYWLAP